MKITTIGLDLAKSVFSGLAPNVAEKQYWIDYKTVAKKT